jgi:hypothetical protein
MRIALFVSLILISLPGCQSVSSTGKSATLRDGSSAELAVDLSAAHNEYDGMEAQKAWLKEHYPGAKVKSQSLLVDKKKTMDLLTISLPSGEEKSVYFDISSYFGKL